jgi:hypothetical protein
MGRIAGPGSPYDKDQVVVDTTDAVLMDTVEVAVVGAIREGKMEEVVLALELAGRVNKSKRREDNLYLFDADGAAAIVSELFGIAQRIGPEFMILFSNRLRDLP